MSSRLTGSRTQSHNDRERGVNGWNEGVDRGEQVCGRCHSDEGGQNEYERNYESASV